ncbi:carbohydrate porin [Aliagarivorans taiwanensis]|uniref:carbohydrate porin n=1 Tax=Aliagarivorans taiwanensis TaxID=561966 RepID=UPI000400C40D|nr:carbohydrate porin [Aliagarivorans taiwanensis]
MKMKALTVAMAAAMAMSGNAIAQDGFSFSGYARYGATYQANEDSLYVGPAGEVNGRSAGRLGNEYNGGEFQFDYNTTAASGARWKVGVMLDHWAAYDWYSSGDVNLKKAFAAGTGIFASQPDMTVWAGRDFHQRPQTNLMDYFWMTHDGQGGGFDNLDLGGAKMNLGFVGQVDCSHPDPDVNGHGCHGNDSGVYAITSKLHSIEVGAATVDFYANYGFTSEAIDTDDAGMASSAYQLAANVKMAGHSLVVRYSDNAQDSVFDLKEDYSALFVHMEGGFGFSERSGMDYGIGYQSVDADDDAEDRVNYNVVVRPHISWDDTHSTWLEAGYSVVDYDEGSKNSAWKLTLSQNMAVGPHTWSRPMLRFYATVGNADNKNDGTDLDTLTLGAMWEAWW